MFWGLAEVVLWVEPKIQVHLADTGWVATMNCADVWLRLDEGL